MGIWGLWRLMEPKLLITEAAKVNSIIPSGLVAIGPIILCSLVLSAAWIDCRTFRIPNQLVVSGLGIGLVLNMALPVGDGFFSMTPGAIGIWLALAGAGVGFGILFPLYLTCTMGAGDVKLMTMIGAFLGPSATLTVILLSFILGGALSVAIAIKNKKLRLLFRNIHEVLLGTILRIPVNGIGKVEPPYRSAGRMPYALAIAGGVFLYLILGGSNVIASSIN